jgi:cell filamentation protein, protein adenylyltransferase
MKPNDFRAPQVGGVVQTQKGYYAFIPAHLPPDLVWSLPLISALSDAERNLSRLTTVASAFPFPKLLIQPFMRREAVLSSRCSPVKISGSSSANAILKRTKHNYKLLP